MPRHTATAPPSEPKCSHYVHATSSLSVLEKFFGPTMGRKNCSFQILYIQNVENEFPGEIKQESGQGGLCAGQISPPPPMLPHHTDRLYGSIPLVHTAHSYTPCEPLYGCVV